MMSESDGFWSYHKASRRASSINKLFRSHSRQSIPVSPSPVISNKLLSEIFWPTTLDKESEKAARILYAFFKHGMYQDEFKEDSSQAVQKQKIWTKVPAEVLESAKGIVIFTAMRAGLWVSGAGGSGVVLARLSDGSWSCPLAIEVHTSELGFLVGVDLYDCLLILNTNEAVDAFSKSRCIIGGDLYAAPGPLSVGWFLGNDTRSKHAPIFSYLRSRGYYAGVQLDHAFVLERSEENKRFYEAPEITARDILTANHYIHPAACSVLLTTVRSSEGVSTPNGPIQPSGFPPSDYEVVEEGHAFGIPDKEDPDPYGVLALEKQGFLIREAGSKTSPTSESFEFNPSVSSPIYERYNRRGSVDHLSSRSSWRKSATSNADRQETGSIISNQTDQESLPPPSPGYSNFRHNFRPNDDRPIAHSRHSSGNLTADASPDSDLGVLKHPSLMRAPKSTPAPQTIYEGRSLDITTRNSQDAATDPEFMATDSIMNRMVDMLQGEDRIQEKPISTEPVWPQPNEKSPARQVQDAKQTPLRIDTSQLQPNKPREQHSETQPKDLQDSQEDNGKSQKDIETSKDASDVVKSEGTDKNKENLDANVTSGNKEEDTLDNKKDDSHEKSDDDDEYFSDLGDEEAGSPVEIHRAVIHGGPAPIYQSAAVVSKPKARIVTVTKPPAPTLPARNPGRLRPAFETQSWDERSQVASSADVESTKSSHKDEKSSTGFSSPTSSPPEEPSLSPISNESDPSRPTRPFSESQLKKDTILEPPKRFSLDNNPTPRPAVAQTTETQPPEIQPRPLSTLANMRQNLDTSPSPEALSPTLSQDYFS